MVLGEGCTEGRVCQAGQDLCLCKWGLQTDILFFLMFIFERERERERERGGAHKLGKGRERERDRDTESEAGSRLSCQHRARRGARTHEPRDRDLSRSRTCHQLSPPRCPGTPFFFFK